MHSEATEGGYAPMAKNLFGFEGYFLAILPDFRTLTLTWEVIYFLSYITKMVSFQPPIFAYFCPFSLVFPILFTEKSLK